MDEFTDIYRIYAKNYNIDIFEKGWKEEDINLLKEKLDKVSPLIENGDLIIDILKREIADNQDGPTFVVTLEHIAVAMFEIEKRVKESGSRSDQNDFVAQAQGPMEDINKEIEKEGFKPEVKLEVKPKITPRDEAYAPFEEVLHSYRNATIYRQVYDYLLETLPDKFNYKNVYDLIDSIYREKPKRKLKNKTLETYAGRYIDYMKMNKKIKIDKESGMFMKITEKEIIEAPDDVWTKDEDEIIIKYYLTMTATEIKLEKLPHRSEQAIYDRALFLKIHKQKRKKKVPEKQKARYPNGGWKGIFPKDQILAKYNTVNIYKPIVDEIMDNKNLPDEFTRKDLTQFLFNYFNKVLNKKISMGTADVYKGRYIAYLIENNLLREKKMPGHTTDLVKIREKSKITIAGIDEDVEKPEIAKEEKQPPVDFANGDTLDEAIYNYAVRTNWINASSVPTLMIEKRFPDSTADEIKTALAKLIQEGKAFQSAPGRIKFLVVEA